MCVTVKANFIEFIKRSGVVNTMFKFGLCNGDGLFTLRQELNFRIQYSRVLRKIFTRKFV